MRVFRTGLLLLALSVPAAFAQVSDTYVIPAAGNTPGQFGTYWKTEFSLFNPQSYPLKVSVTFLPNGGAQGSEVPVIVPANALEFSDDVIQDLYGLTNATGALLVATFPEDNPTVPNNETARSFLLTTNTYTEDPTTHGIYGQTIPGAFATYLRDYSVEAFTAVAHGIRNDASQFWRTNIGAVNLGRSNVTVLVSVYDENGDTVIKDAPMDVPPMAQWQEPLDKMSPVEGVPVVVNPGSLEFSVTNDALKNDPNQYAVVFPYVSVVDDISGDPQYQMPTILALATSVFKTGTTATSISMDQHRIGTDIARRVRNGAVRLGEARLKVSPR